MVHIEQNRFDKDVYRVTSEGNSQAVIFWRGPNGTWWVGRESYMSRWDKRDYWQVYTFDEVCQAGGQLSAQVAAIEMLNSLAG